MSEESHKNLILFPLADTTRTARDHIAKVYIPKLLNLAVNKLLNVVSKPNSATSFHNSNTNRHLGGKRQLNPCYFQLQIEHFDCMEGEKTWNKPLNVRSKDFYEATLSKFKLRNMIS